LINDRYGCQLLCSDKCIIPERIEFIAQKEKQRERERTVLARRSSGAGRKY
jgi:hypothetical protein